MFHSLMHRVWKVNGRTTDAKWWQYLTWPFGSGELKKNMERPKSYDILEADPDIIVLQSFFFYTTTPLLWKCLDPPLICHRIWDVPYSFLAHLTQRVMWGIAITWRPKNCPWRPYLLAEWDEMKKLYRGPYIDAFCQVWFHLVQLFQRSRLKYEKLTD
jgi:hypothetical protein